MKPITTTMTAAATSVASPLALAHPGHDHAVWTSGLIHAITAMALVGAGAVALHVVRRRGRQALKAESTTPNEGR